MIFYSAWEILTYILRRFIEMVDSRYLKANRILLDLLLKENNLLDRLRYSQSQVAYKFLPFFAN